MSSTVVTDKGYKVAQLICVTGVNNNKFYNMTQISADEFEAEWGRVEGTSDKKNYPMSDWDKVYKDKTRSSKKPKPYTDVTSFRADVTINESKSGKSIFNENRTAAVKNFVEMLMKFANQSVEKNYTVSSAKVTKAQVEEAQKVIDEITPLFKLGASTDEINDKLIDLYHIIPRKMKKVQDCLLEAGTTIKTKDELKKYTKERLQAEQDALDAMSGQVSMQDTEKDATQEQKQEHDILHTLGLELSECRPSEIEMIKDMMKGPENNDKLFVRAYRVNNSKTQKQYDKWLNSVKNKETKLLWHGSRNENWWSIMQQGLKIRPSNAVLTGSMFGDAMYFASKCQKSIGYTSLNGAYWTKGGEKTAVLALYEIHAGKQKVVTSSDSSLCWSKISKTGHDSVWAKASNGGLRNDEFMVYQECQNTIQFLVEIRQK